MLTEFQSKSCKVPNAAFNIDDEKIHFLEITGVWEQAGKLRTALYNNYRGEMSHMSTEGNHMLDALYLQIRDILSEHNLNRPDVPTRNLTGKCNNGKIKLYH
jgi:hypothetical protein